MGEQTTILILAANPQATSRLRLDEEVRSIEAGLRSSRMRDQFEIVQRWSVRPRDIQRAMLEVQPQIVHFSGHGKGEAGLVFEDSAGLPKLIDGQALARLFDLFSDTLKCVILNGCYSEIQAKLISQYVDYVVGMRSSIRDDAAIAFSVGFYDALGAGRSVDFAYQLACNAIMMEGFSEELQPILLISNKDPKDSQISTVTKDSGNKLTENRRIKIFLSYSHADQALLKDLTNHLSLLKRSQVIEPWHDRDIAAGTEWAGEIDEHLDAADLILLLISPDFLASNYCYDVEMARAMERHKAGEARVVPVILRPVDWTDAPFGRLQGLPSDAKPVTSWPNQDLALLDVAKGIRAVCEELLRREVAKSADPTTDLQPRIRQSGQEFKLFDVFKTHGTPTVTFVEPEKFHLLKLALEQPGVGIIIEGPSGIGKSTALKHALTELGLKTGNTVKELSARKPEDISSIKSLTQWHSDGIAVIDDFHRLEDTVQRVIVDYLKWLADHESAQKLVIVGIPSTGKRLVKLAGDIATRVRFFKLGRVSEETITKMIRRGERALNIIFDHKTDIARSSSGSLNVAQFLCYHLAAREKIEVTQSTTEVLTGSLEAAISEVMEGELALKFEDTVRCFASMGEHTEMTCIEILRALAENREGYLSLKHFKDGRPHLADGINNFIEGQYVSSLYADCPESANYILYDERLSAVIVDDPQLTFYLSNTSIDKLAMLAGKAGP